VTYLVDAKNRITRQVTEAARLNEELTRAQLTALRRQLEPHFIYNTLNTIAGLVRDRRNQAAVPHPISEHRNCESLPGVDLLASRAYTACERLVLSSR